MKRLIYLLLAAGGALRGISIFLLGLILFCPSVHAQQLPKVACGHIERVKDFASSYVEPRNVDIWLPPGYARDKKYSVLYMEDGQALFDSTLMWNHEEWGVDETMCRLLAARKIKDCIVVGIWNTARRRPEYFPQHPFESLPGAQKDTLLHAVDAYGKPVFSVPPFSDKYLQFLVTELKPYIDSHYSTAKDQRHTFVAGSSMGGLISLYAICEYPEVFYGAACLSTHWTGVFTGNNNPLPGALINYLRYKLPDPKNHKIYFDHGTATLDTLYGPYQKQVDIVMKAKGYGPANWESKVYRGAAHDERSWNRRLENPLLFLMKK
jgi:enterochelin esterase-like enzyme